MRSGTCGAHGSPQMHNTKTLVAICLLGLTSCDSADQASPTNTSTERTVQGGESSLDAGLASDGPLEGGRSPVAPYGPAFPLAARSGPDASASGDGSSGGGGASDAPSGPVVTTPAPMLKISQGLPTYANYAQSPASNAVDADYSTAWRTGHVAAAGDSNWLAIDLSSVPAAQRTTLYSAWSTNTATTTIRRTRRATRSQATLRSRGMPRPAAGHLPRVGGRRWPARRATCCRPARICSPSAATTGCGSNARPARRTSPHRMAIRLCSGTCTTRTWATTGGSSVAIRSRRTRWGTSRPTTASTSSPRQDRRRACLRDGRRRGLVDRHHARNIDAFFANFPGRYFGLALGTNDAPGNDRRRTART